MEATTAAKKITGKKLVLRYIGKTTEIVQVASDVLVANDSIMFLEMIDNVGRLRSVWYSLDGLESFTYEGDLKYLASDKTIKISPNMQKGFIMNEIKLVVKRVEEERDELKKKVYKLEAGLKLLDKTPYVNITEEHLELLKGQLSVMHQYLDILERRLELFKQDVK